MDMSVKLNLSYPPVAAQAAMLGSSAAAQPAVDTTQAAPAAPPNGQDLKQAVKDIQDFAQSLNRKLDFSIDESTGIVVVKVFASESGDLIRQLPSETALKLAQSMKDAGSLLFDAKV